MIEIIKHALVAGWFAKQNMFSIIKPSWLKTDSLFWSSSKRMHMANNDWRCKLQITNDSEFHPLVNYWRKKRWWEIIEGTNYKKCVWFRISPSVNDR